MFRHPARIFAPLSLVACAIAVLMIVNHNSSSGGSSTTSTTTTAGRTTATTKQSAKSHRHTYIVKSGDTLSAIALKTGVSLATIQQLNPRVDAQSLHAGQKLKLTP